jgi:hypothetical protein
MAINWSNVTDLGQLPSEANTATGGHFWLGMLFMIWAVMVMIMIGYGLEVALLTASFAGLIIGLLLSYAGLVSFNYVLVFVGILIVMFLYIVFNKRS